MPIINLPKLGAVNFRDDLTQEQFKAELERLSKKYEFDIPRAEFGLGELATRGVKRGVKELGSTFGDVVPAMVAKGLGFDEYAQEQMQEAAQTRAEIEAEMPAMYRSTEDVRGISDYPGFALETIAEQAPNIVTSLIPGVGIGAAGTRVAVGALAKEAVKRGLTGAAAEQFIAQNAAKIAAGKATGQAAGIYLGSYAQNTPEIFQNIYEATGEMEPGVAALYGTVSSALDAVLPSKILKGMSQPFKASVAEKILERSGMDSGLLRKTLLGTTSGAAFEGLTESAQEAISIAAEKFVAKNEDVWDSKDFNRMIQAGVRGAVAGGAFGAVGGVGEQAAEGRQRRDQYGQALEKRAERLRAGEVRRAGEDIAALGGVEAQGVLPGFEAGPATGLYAPEVVAPEGKELTGKQAELFTETGEPTKGAAKSVAAGEKIAKQQEQQRKKELAQANKEFKEAQARLRKLVSGKQLELPLVEAPPAGGVAVEGQGDLFAQPAPQEALTTEPVIVPKKGAVTPEELATKISDDVLKGLGIGPTALIRRNKLLEGLDITDPAQAAQVKDILSQAYLGAGSKTSEKIRNKIEAYLSRPEFAAKEVPSEQLGETLAGTSEPSIPTTERVGRAPDFAERIGEPLAEGLAGIRPTAAAPVVGETVLDRPLGVKAQKDLTKAEQAIDVAKKEQASFIAENDQRAQDLLMSDLRSAATAENVDPDLLPSEDFKDTDAFKYLRLPGLLQEHIRLSDVINTPSENTPAARAQRAKNVQELDVINKAIEETTPEARDILDALDGMPPEVQGRTISQLNRMGREAFAPILKERLDSAKEAAREKAKVKPKEITEEAYDEISDRILKAIDSKKFSNYVDAVLGSSKDPQDKLILEKVKRLNLRTKVVVGEVAKKKGLKAEDNVGEYDPTTDTITLDPKTGLTTHAAYHELVHAAISHVLRNTNHPLTKELTSLFNNIANQLGDAYGAQDVQEFAAELLSNPEFQAILKDIQAPRGGNMFQRMMQAIAEFFGFRKGTSAYDAGLKTITDIIDISKDVEASPADKMFLGVGKSVNQAFEAVGQIGKNMPALTGKAVEDAKNTFSNIKERGLLNAGMGLLRLDNINKIYGKELPSVQKLLDALEMRNGEQENRIKTINDHYDRFVKAVQANPQAAERMNNMAYDARLAGVDPLDANFKTTPSNVAEYQRLRGIYTSLPKNLQEVYKTIRGEYEASLNEYEKIILDAVSPSLKARLQQEFATKKRLTAYIPFLRRGDFWVEYADPASGERAAHAFESVRERQQFMDTLNKQGIEHRAYENINDIRFAQNKVPPTSFIGKIMADLQKQGASREQLDSVYQSYLALFPGESIFKQFMKSENVRGMERDIVRGYGDTMIKWARKITNSKYSPQIDTAVDEIQAQAENAGTPDLMAAAQNITDQRDFYHNPTFGKFTHAATTFSYFEYIAGNISSALINITSLPMLVWPTLGAKFGFDKAASAMARASKVAVNGMQNDAKYKKLYDFLMDHAQLKHTMAREVLEGRRTTTQDFTGIKAKIMDGLSIPFAATEQYNRATTAIAAYDLARAKGMNEQEAMRYALDTVKDLHTSGMAATAPKLFQTAPGRIFFTFKSYVWNSAFIMARAFHQAFKGESPEIRAEARRQLLGIYGMSMAFAGVKGLPFYGAVSTLATMISALFGDDDDPFDLDNELRSFFGELGYKGFVNYATNLEIANRTGLANDLVFRDDPRGIAEHGYVLSAMQQAFGPAGSYMVGAERSIKAFNEGHTERAIEGLVPSFVRNAMKGARYMTEGATTLKGDPIKDDISAYNGLMQAFGFAPADLSASYELTSARKGYERQVLQRRAKLLNLYDMAKTSGDIDLMGDVQEKVNSFNAAHPRNAITPVTLQKSYMERRRREREMIDGISYNRKLKPEIMEKFE